MRKGKIRHLGISIGSNENIWQTRQAGAVGAEAIQVVYNRIDRAPEREVLPECKKQNLGVLARVPLASGYLSGKYRPGAKFGSNDVRGKWHSDEDRERQLAEVEKIKKEEVPGGVDMAAWALGKERRRGSRRLIAKRSGVAEPIPDYVNGRQAWDPDSGGVGMMSMGTNTRRCDLYCCQLR